jgi:hypothetical protein
VRALRFIAPFFCLFLAAFGVCNPAPVAQVTMVFNNNLPTENNRLTSAELGTFNISTTFSKSRKEMFTVGGVTVSDYSPQFLITFSGASDPITGKSCLAAEKIELSLNYSPVIYIATEYKPGSCRYKEIMLHEARHVNTDIITFREYLPIMQAEVQQAAAKLKVMGPLAAHEVLPARDKTVDALKAALGASIDKISSVLHQRQQAIDTRAEYIRTSRACPHEPIVGSQ